METLTDLAPPWPDWFINLREHQAQAISEIMAGFDSSDVVIMQAPTGSGKTVIAEYVRRLLGVPGVYSCTTKALQDQVLRAFPYTHVLKGRANYATELYPERFGDVWASAITCADCTGVSCSYCTSRDTCPYQIAKGEALGSPLAVLNTSYYLSAANLTYSKHFMGHPFKIFDEADELESELLRFVSLEITKRRQQRYNIPSPGKKTVEMAWVGWTFVAIERLQVAIEEEKSHTAHSDRDKRIKQRVISGLNELLRKLHIISEDLQETAITGEPSWIYTGYDSDKIEFKPLTVDKFGNEYLWSHPGKKLLMSGSVISPDFMADNLGIDNFTFVNVDSTFPAENRKVYYSPVGSMSMKNKSMTMGPMIEEIANLLDQHKEERVLVHTHSYSNTKAIAAGLHAMGYTDRIITYYSSDEKDTAIQEYVDNPYGVILASSLDRGYDFPGDMCRLQIICKVPAPYLGDKQISARMYRTRGGKLWYAVQTIRSIVQMCGRGVRSKDDWCKTVILDSDFDRLYQTRKMLFPKYWRDGFVTE